MYRTNTLRSLATLLCDTRATLQSITCQPCSLPETFARTFDGLSCMFDAPSLDRLRQPCAIPAHRAFHQRTSSIALSKTTRKPCGNERAETQLYVQRQQMHSSAVAGGGVPRLDPAAAAAPPLDHSHPPSHKPFQSGSIDPIGRHDTTIIWLHGMGQTGGVWVAAAEDSLLPHLPHCRLVLPTAPVRPVERLHGRELHAWMDSEGHADRFDERCTGLEESVAAVEALLDAEVKGGTSACCIVLGGFSQGGALAAHVALRTKHQLGGLLVVNGYLPGLHRTPLLVRQRLPFPMLWCHGSNDTYVHLEDGWRAFQVLYTGSMSKDTDSIASRNLRQMWTYDRFSAPTRRTWRRMLEDEEGGHSDDDGHEFESLRGKMSIQPDVSWATPHVKELHGPACLMPHYDPLKAVNAASSTAAAAASSSLTSFVTFPGVGHAITDEMMSLILDWVHEVLGPDPCPHPGPRKREDPWSFARNSTL